MIGNPPYIRIQDLNQYEGVVDYYSKKYITGTKGNYDIYVLFIELGMSLSNGECTYILPHKFINANYGLGTRDFISNNNYLNKLTHFGAHQIFEDATTYTCLLFLDKYKKSNFSYNEVKDIQKWKASPDKYISSVTYKAIERDEWLLLNGKEYQLFEKILNSSKPLAEISSRIFQGLKTSADKIYIVKKLSEENGKLRFSCPQDDCIYEAESKLFHTLIKGGDSKKYYFRETELMILFPYNDGSLIKSELLKRETPLTWKYLEKHREYLENREKGKMKTDNWYGYGRSQALNLMSLPKIFTPDIAPHPSFMIDASGKNFFTGGAAGGYGILAENIEPYSLLGQLNSQISKWYISKTSTQMRGGWFSFESRFIKNLPIAVVHNEQSKKITEKVNQILNLKKDDVTANTSILEHEIDKLVYEVYDLTEEEIKIIVEANA